MACSNLSHALELLNQSCNALQTSFLSCRCNASTPTSAAGSDAASSVGGGEEDPCAAEIASYGVNLHIASIFIVLGASFLGTLLPLLQRCHEKLALSPYLICLGKCLAAGVVISVGLIHMLLPAHESLSNECLPLSFTESYGAYAFLFAMIATLLMHALETVIELVIRDKYSVVETAVSIVDMGHSHNATEGNVITTVDEGNETVASGTAATDEAIPVGSLTAANTSTHGSTTVFLQAVSSTAPPPQAVAPSAAADEHSAVQPVEPSTGMVVQHNHHSHMMSKEEASSPLQRIIAAVMMEFGVTIHSVFVGLAVGVVSDDKLTELVIALCFHQFFEGIALGSRLAEASFHQKHLEMLLSLAFSIASPVGMSVGVALISSGRLNPNGSTFLLVQGSFDGFCAGILLFLGYGLIFNDFTADMQRHCDRQCVEWRGLRRFGMFACLWTGAGVMAFLGKYL